MVSQYQTLAREALNEITSPSTVGEVASEHTDDDGVITVRFESTLGGYPGWQWNVSLAHVEGYDPTVIEAELLPAAGALLAPDWVPWSERLAEYQAAQEAAGLDADAIADDTQAELAEGELDDDDDLDDDDLDDDDEDDGRERLLSSNLHSGDLDGVDIDEFADGPEDEGPEDEGPEGVGPEDETEGDEADAIADEVNWFGEADQEDVEN